MDPLDWHEERRAARRRTTDLGRAIALAIAVTLVVVALVVAFTTPPLSGGTIAAGILLVLAGVLTYPSLRKGR